MKQRANQHTDVVQEEVVALREYKCSMQVINAKRRPKETVTRNLKTSHFVRHTTYEKKKMARKKRKSRNKSTLSLFFF